MISFRMTRIPINSYDKRKKNIFFKKEEKKSFKSSQSLGHSYDLLSKTYLLEWWLTKHHVAFSDLLITIVYFSLRTQNWEREE